MKKNGLLYTGCFIYLVLLCLSVVYYQERTLFSDIAYHVFRFITTRTFCIRDRFVAIFTQAFPLTAVYMHLPLKTLLIGYSSAFIVHYFLAFVVCIVVLRQRGFALAMLLFSIFIVRNTFFWIQSELPQGIALCMILFAFMAWLNEARLKKIWPAIILLVLICFVVFAHPLMMFVFGLPAIYFFLRTGIIDRKIIAISATVFVLVWIFKRFAIPVSEYDAQAMLRAGNIRTLFPHYLNLPANIRFADECLQHYYAIPLAFLSVSIALFWRRAWVTGLFFVCSTIGYLLFINVTFFEYASETYMENLYLSLSVLLILPLVFEVLLPVAGKNWFLPLLVIFFVFRVIDIVDGSSWFRNRLTWNKQLLEQTSHWPNRKLIIPTSLVPAKTLEVTWAESYELLELSSLHSPDSSRCILIDDVAKQDLWRLQANRSFLAKYNIVDFDSLDPHYFHPTDTADFVLLDHL